MSCHGPDADLVSAVDAEGILCRVALEAMHTGHFTFGIFDGGCGIPSMCFRMRMVRCQTLRIYCTQESLHRRISSIPGNYRHQATTHPLRTDQGGEFINHPMQALLTEHLTNHVVCAKDEHYSVGATETAVQHTDTIPLRTARERMLSAARQCHKH